MSHIHIDEATGSDETGKGTPELPYQSLAFAIFSHPAAALLVRKDAQGTYEEPTQSALKKAKKNAEGLEKKRKKAQELAEREAKEKKEAEDKARKEVRLRALYVSRVQCSRRALCRKKKRMLKRYIGGRSSL